MSTVFACLQPADDSSSPNTLAMDSEQGLRMFGFFISLPPVPTRWAVHYHKDVECLHISVCEQLHVSIYLYIYKSRLCICFTRYGICKQVSARLSAQFFARATVRSSSPKLAKKTLCTAGFCKGFQGEGAWWRDRLVAGIELCDKCWALSRRTSKSWVTLSCTHATTLTNNPCLGMRVWAFAVEAVLQRLLFHFNFMPTRELLNRHLEGRDCKDFNDLQGRIIWFLINKNVSHGAWTKDFWTWDYSSLIKVDPLSTIYVRKSIFNTSRNKFSENDV